MPVSLDHVDVAPQLDPSLEDAGATGPEGAGSFDPPCPSRGDDDVTWR